jgi:hypothetical protein
MVGEDRFVGLYSRSGGRMEERQPGWHL